MSPPAFLRTVLSQRVKTGLVTVLGLALLAGACPSLSAPLNQDPAFDVAPLRAKIFVVSYHDVAQMEKGVKISLTSVETTQRGTLVDFIVLFAHPSRDRFDAVNMACSVTVTNPKGITIFNQSATPCYHQIPPTDTMGPFNVQNVITFRGEPADPVGTYTVHVTLRDQHSGEAVSDSASFGLR